MDKQLTARKRELIFRLGAMIQNASDQDLNVIYGLVMGFVLSKGNTQ